MSRSGRGKGHPFLAIVILAVVIIGGSIATLAAYGVIRFAVASGTNFDHVVVIMMENEGIYDICHTNPPPCGTAAAPFMAKLANNYTIAQQYTSVYTPLTSAPNYVAMIGGSTFACTSGGCGNFGSITNTNLIDRLETAGLSWKAYIENYPAAAGCITTSGGLYNNNHNPYLYFGDILNNPTRCAKIVNANPTSCTTTDCTLTADLSSTSAPNFMWLTPNECDNMHGNTACVNCPTGFTAGCITGGDQYLASLVPSILNSFAFQSGRGVLFITFDEGNGFCPLNGGSADCVYAVWAGPQAAKGKTSATAYSHYSLLHTVENNWGLATLTANDAAATPMTEYLLVGSGINQLNVAFAWSPPTPVAGSATTFSASVSGGTLPYSYSWSWGDGTPATLNLLSSSTTHTFGTAGSYSVTLTVSDTSTPKQTMSVTAPVTVVNPTAALNTAFTFAPASPQVGNTVTFSSTVSGGTQPYTISWNFGDLATDSGTTVNHAYGAPGSYTVTMTVTDSGSPTQSQTTNKVVTINQPPPPTLACSFNWAPTVAIVNQAVTFTATTSGGVPPVTYGWNFGDGGLSVSGGSSVVHSYTRTGSFNVTLLVTDSAFSQCAIISTITVMPGVGGGGLGGLLSSLYFTYLMFGIIGIGAGASVAVFARPSRRKR